MELKVGDKVRIKSKKWYDENKDKEGFVNINPVFTSGMSYYCGNEAKVTAVSSFGCLLDVDKEAYWWSMKSVEPINGKESLIKDIAEIIRSNDMGVIVSEQDGKLIIEPIKEGDDLPIDTPCMITDHNDDITSWAIRYYAGNGKTYNDGRKKEDNVESTEWKYIIPFDKFDPNNIEESLKYNVAR